MPSGEYPDSPAVFSRGQKLAATHLQKLSDQIIRQNDVLHGEQIVVPIAPGSIREVRIGKAVAIAQDATNADLVAEFTENGPFLLCYPMLEGPPIIPDFDEPLYVRPIGQLAVADFKYGNAQIYAALDTEPSFFIQRTQLGLTLIFGAGIKLVQPPYTEQMCTGA